VESNGRDVYTRLGYDPVQDQYKVLCVMMFDGHDANQQDIQQEHFVFTLSSQQKKWRKIDITKEEDPYRHMKGGICIDGAIHYGVLYRKIARFDVRTEKIEFIQGPEDFNAISCYSTLINYQGKLACVAFDPYCNTEMGMYILQDVEKQEWSSIITCDVPSEWGDLFEKERSLCTGKIHTGEVMIVSTPARLKSYMPFFVNYCDITRESIRRCEIDGIADYEFRRIHGIGKRTREMLCFPGHIENIILPSATRGFRVVLSFLIE